MDEQPSAKYRERAAELRAAADRMVNVSIKKELLKSAESYDNLAEQVSHILDSPKTE